MRLLRRTRRGWGSGMVTRAVRGVGQRVGAGGKGPHDGEILLNCRPCGGVLLRGKRQVEVGVVGEDIGLNARRDRIMAWNDGNQGYWRDRYRRIPHDNVMGFESDETLMSSALPGLRRKRPRGY